MGKDNLLQPNNDPDGILHWLYTLSQLLKSSSDSLLVSLLQLLQISEKLGHASAGVQLPRQKL